MTELGMAISLQAGDALFLDFDGTLAGLQDDPETVYLVEGLAEILETCAARLDGALAVISGRDLDDLSKRVPNTLWRFGNHGMRAAAPGLAPSPDPMAQPEGLKSAIEAAIAGHEGVRIEDKGAVLAIHYRAAPEAGEWLTGALSEALKPYEDYKLQHGKMVFEAKPRAANKGTCLALAVQRSPFAGRRVVMIGDDTTDEDAFAAAQTAGGLAIKVGSGTTIADYRLSSVSDVHELLKDFLAG